MKAAPILIVVAVGIGAVVFVTRGHGTRPAEERSAEQATEAEAPAKVQEPQATSQDRFRLAEIENRLTSIENGTAMKHVTPSAANIPARRPSQEERVRQIERDFEDHQQRLNQSAAEPRNDSWAAPMEQKINAAYHKVPDGVKLRYSGVDCRSTTCAVTFVWPSRGAAEEELRLVTTSLAATGCMREIALAPPDGRNSETEGQMLLMCGNANGAAAARN